MPRVADPLREPQRLAAELTQRQPAELRLQLPHYPLGVLQRLLEHQTVRIKHDDVLHALRTIAALRRTATFLELQLLHRGLHWKAEIHQDKIAEALGISISAVTKRRQRLPRVVAGTARRNASPIPPKINRATAEAAAEEILDRREKHQTGDLGILPEPQDLLGTVTYALTHEDHIDIKNFVRDISPSLQIVTLVRAELDPLELAWQRQGRNVGVPEKDLGEPFGRRDQWASWKARRRLENGIRPGGRRTAARIEDPTDDPPPNTTPPGGADEEAIRRLAGDLVTLYEELIADPDTVLDAELDYWLHELAREGLHDDAPLNPGKLGLLWTVIREMTSTAYQSASMKDLVDRGKHLRKLVTTEPSAHP